MQNEAKMQHLNAKIVQNTRAADVVLIGRVKSVGRPPRAWSGAFAASQSVDYQVLRVLKKPDKDVPQSIVVFHPVVHGSTTADTAVPRLRESLFSPGAEFILFIREKNSRYETFDENFGVLPNDASLLQKVERAIREPAPVSR